MLISGFVRALLVITALAPVLGTLAILEATSEVPCLWEALAFAGAAASLALLCRGLLRAAGSRLSPLSIQLTAVRSTDRDTVGILLTYLLPLVGLSTGELLVWIFVLFLVAVVLWKSNSVHANPLLLLLGWRFYEVTASSGVTMTLLTDRVIRTPEDIRTVAELGPGVVLEVRGES